MNTIHYSHPLDFGSIFANKVEGFLYGMGYRFQEKFEEYYSLGITPIVKNEMYPFYVVDYGFLVSIVLSWLKKNGEDNIAEQIEKDFTKSNEFLNKNGKYFISVLEYFDIAFRQKNLKSFYIKNLYFNERTNAFFIINSVAINRSAFDKFCGYDFAGEYIEMPLKKFNNELDLVAYGSNITKSLNYQKRMHNNQIKVYNFWSTSGINYDLL